jgi:hypothetical protein
MTRLRTRPSRQTIVNTRSSPISSDSRRFRQNRSTTFFMSFSMYSSP